MALGGDGLALADRFHRFGAFGPAAQLYGEVLREWPDRADVWCRLGEVCHALGRSDEAAGCYRRALTLRPDDPVPPNNLGFVLMAQGRLAEAAGCYQEALRLQPDYPEAHNNLGIVLLRQGRPGEAVACFDEALLLRPDYPEAHNNLGTALAAEGRLELALASFRQAVELQPNFHLARANLGNVLRSLGRHEEAAACDQAAMPPQPGNPDRLHELGLQRLAQGRLEEAVSSLEQALRLQPHSAGVCNNLGNALLRQGRAPEASLSFRQAVFLEPDLAQAHNNLGLALLHQGREHEALDSLRQAVCLKPDLAQAHNNLGLAFWRQDRREEALDCFRQALHVQPDLADAHNNLGLALAARGLPDLALSCYERAVQLEPAHGGALANLGNACKDQGRLTEALACYRAALSVRPDDPQIHSNLLLALHYQAGADPKEVLAESRRFAQRHAAPLAGLAPPGTFQPLEGRSLRVGYVSPDFREHPVSYFLEPILSSHDHSRFEIFCYADVPRADAVTERCQRYADHWRSLVGLSDARAAELIRRDGIDLLIDLAGHTGGNRLLVFARKPAPVQATYLGYLGTTGLAAIDYYITDGHTDPPGLTEAHFQERLVRLPECGMCYRPGDAPGVHPEPPARRFGQVTFASLNTLAKLSEDVLALWLQVLAAVPGSRLLLRTGEGRAGEERIRAVVSRHGVSPERVLLLGRTPTRLDYLKPYLEVDLALDPFPYNGITTTCDALWMGVPVLTLAGRMSVSRYGVRFLNNVGLDELITDSPKAYLRLAAELALDLDRLASLRSGLRERMSRSPLMDAARFTRNLELAFLTISHH
ncbi:MAG: tetratricopeptide repeat protein [Isosphaerales bacterium]